MKRQAVPAAQFRERLGLLMLGLGISLAVCGFYAAMTAFQMATGSLEDTRALTVPLRVIIVLLLIFGALLLGRKRKEIEFPLADILLIIFSVSYLLRIYVSRGESYILHREPMEILLYFLAFCLFPFVSIRLVNMNEVRAAFIYKIIMVGALAFAVLTSIAFQDIIDIGARAAISFGADNVISPLFLSYCGALGVGLSVAGLFQPAANKRLRGLLLATAVMSLIPFFVGGSRGAIIALLAPFLIFMPVTRSSKFWVRVWVFVVLIVFLGVASLYLDLTAFRRLSEISSDIESGAAEASRVYLWSSSIEQFWNDPFFGKSLQNEVFRYYPHNFLLEAFISTGILGGVPLAVTVALCLWKCRQITKEQPANYWTVVLFVQTLFHAFFSGALYSAAWLSTSMALLLTFSYRTNSVRRHARSLGYHTETPSLLRA